MVWQSWNKKAFARARKEKKPILLCISASWCHWCHTMQRLTYNSAEVIKFVNQNFIPVRVDTDERPDINERYNVGGWPTTLILAHDGEPVLGATYVAPEFMISFLSDGIKRFSNYKQKKKEAKSEPKEIKIMGDEIYTIIKQFYDPQNGGFGLEPKFPHEDILEYLVWRGMVKQDSDAIKMLNHSLSAMLKSELFDKEGGGFYRYAALRNWTIPHFEKMLETNARLLSLYSHGAKLCNNQEFKTAANRILFFIYTTLYDHKTGVFFSSQDADETYCSLPLSRRVKTTPPAVDKRIFTADNALACLCLFEIGQDKVALKTLNWLFKNRVKKQVFRINDVILLKDTVYLLLASLSAYASTKDIMWKKRAIAVGKQLYQFEDKKHGGFFDRLPNQKDFGRLNDLQKPVRENTSAYFALIQLFELTKNKSHLESAKKAIKAVSFDAVAMGAYAALYAVAVEDVSNSVITNINRERY